MQRARILTSENDASVKTEQNTNVNIAIQRPSQQYPSVPFFNQIPTNNNSSNSSVNFTQPTQEMNMSASPFQQQIARDRGITDLSNELESLDMKNKFLELLVEMYADNPLKINSYVICKSSLLMNMIKLLTGCEKVDFVLADEEVGCGCSASPSKLIKIDKILVTKDGKTEELKYAYNNIYTEFIKYAISLKFCV